MEAKLIVVGGKASKRDVPLKLPTTIGRSRQADLTVAHPMVSRQHCELYEEDGVLKLRDLGSLNGTFVEGTRISEACLRPDMQFAVGPLTFLAKYEYAGDVESIPLPEGVGEQEAAETGGEVPDFQAVEPEPGIDATPQAGQVPALAPNVAPEGAEVPNFSAWADPEALPADPTPVVQAEPRPIEEVAPVEFELDEEEGVEPTPPPPVQSAATAAEAETEPSPAKPESKEPLAQVSPEQAAPVPVEEPLADQPAEDEAEPPVLFDLREDAPLVPPEEAPVDKAVEIPVVEAPVEETAEEPSAEKVQVGFPAPAELESSDVADEEPLEVFTMDAEQPPVDEELSEEEEEEEATAKGKKRRWWPFGKRKSKQPEAEPEEEEEEAEPEGEAEPEEEEEEEEELQEEQPEAEAEPIGLPAGEAPASQEPASAKEPAVEIPDFLVGDQAEPSKGEPEGDEGLDDFFKGLS